MSTEFKKQFEQLSKMSHYIRPDQAWVASNKQKMMQQIHNSTASEKKQSSWLENVEFWMPRSRVLAPLRLAVVLFVICGMTIGSWIAGVSASNGSLPGEVMYKVKIATENTQLALTSAFSSHDDKASNTAKLQLQFAERRSKEVKKLVAQKNPESTAQVPPTIQKLKETIQDAQDNLKEVTKGGTPETIISLAQDVTEKTSAIAQDLKDATDQSADQDTTLAKEVIATSKIVNDTGLQAIEVVLQDKKVVDASSQEAIKGLVQEKVDILVQNIADSKAAVEHVKQLSALATSTLGAQINMSSSTLPALTTDLKISTTTAAQVEQVETVSKEEVKKAGDSIKKADQAAGEVKVLLDGNNVKEAIQKAKTLNDLTTETQQVIVDTKNKVNAVLPQINVSASTTVSASVTTQTTPK